MGVYCGSIIGNMNIMIWWYFEAFGDIMGL